jgi:hypothetical protein
MSLANQTSKQTTLWHGRAALTAIAAGALVLILLTALITSIAIGGLAPRIGATAPAAVGDSTNAGLVEFRRGERGLESVVIAAQNSALEEFRRGEQGGSVGATTVDANPDPALVEFRRGERGS